MKKTYISLSISKSLLHKIEKDIKAKNRSQKICACVEKGLEILTNSKGEMKP